MAAGAQIQLSNTPRTGFPGLRHGLWDITPPGQQRPSGPGHEVDDRKAKMLLMALLNSMRGGTSYGPNPAAMV